MKKTSKGTGKKTRFEELDQAFDAGIMDAVVDMQREKFDTFEDFVRVFVRTTVMADTYWELFSQHVGRDDKIVERIAKKIRDRHTKMIRVYRGPAGHLEIQVSEEVPEIH